ncbi:glycogen debranching N-terminal domain-containing protein [Micromonospora olivasterospora]|uniref:Glycogen debranching enzyme n=1 Tax=Micromonospora olivasterospora TaxID=1880 RepID=A0A562IE31_MICOL|nr:glycogen debranching N-terminal domain-containing protein [Micromonospora olivasterospora]TWH69230.1 glycogen debranching enzyme [Micromonospora olivasterospora]
MKQETVHVMAGNTFAVSDAQGDMTPDPLTLVGLFSFDTRFLSRWVLTVDGQRLNSLSRDETTYFEAKFVLVPGAASHYVDADVSVIRYRAISESLYEQVTVLNHATEPARLTVRLEIASDFADTAEIQRPRPRNVQVTPLSDERELRLCYQRGRFARETIVSSTAPVEVDAAGMTFRIELPPNGSWSTDLHVRTLVRGAGGRDLRESVTAHREPDLRDMRDDLRRWRESAPRLIAEHDVLADAYDAALVNLLALQYAPLAHSERLPIGGMPWAMTLYGRDALITCLETLPFTPDVAAATLRTLAYVQGGQLDDHHDEEPGKILAESRYGETAVFGELAGSVYFGAADTTPLFVILLDEYERWSGDSALVHELRHPARMALDWIDRYGDLTGDGYLRYLRRSPSGVENQCWKNSPGAIVDRHGRVPDAPRATCELQGYVYDAKLRGARLARQFLGDAAYADRLERDAAELKERFNRDFWLPDRGYYALALTPDGEPVDALASNMGHLLWSHIVPADRAAAVAEHLMGPRLFSGWGVRTLAKGQRPYNPVGAHVGAVWPSDNAIIAAGLRRYGYDEAAARIAAGIYGVVEAMGTPTPEMIAGYDRDLTGYPVRLPNAGRPQSWSSGALLMLLSTMLGLGPCGDNLLVDPALPRGFGRIELLGVPGRWGRADAYGRDHALADRGRRVSLR